MMRMRGARSVGALNEPADEMARRDLVPGPRQAGGNRQFVLVFADRGLGFDRERHNDLPDVGHEAAAVDRDP
jgi:hypothetical protein